MGQNKKQHRQTKCFRKNPQDTWCLLPEPCSPLLQEESLKATQFLQSTRVAQAPVTRMGATPLFPVASLPPELVLLLLPAFVCFLN